MHMKKWEGRYVMPANFTEEQRQDIQERLISAGYELIRETGLKKMKVAVIAERVGIATGTFYHFFDSKEACVKALIDAQSEKLQEQLLAALDSAGKIAPKQMIWLLRDSFRAENNILMELTLDDWVWLKSHMAETGMFQKAHDEQEAVRYLSYVEGIRPDLDIRIMINFFKTIYSMAQNRDTFIKEVFETNIDMIFDCIYSYAVPK